MPSGILLDFKCYQTGAMTADCMRPPLLPFSSHRCVEQTSAEFGSGSSLLTNSILSTSVRQDNKSPILLLKSKPIDGERWTEGVQCGSK